MTPIPAARLRSRSTHPSIGRAGAGLLAVTLLAAGALPASAQADPAIFDSSTVHAISVTFDQAEYDAMITAFKETGDKEWIEATVTIDGVTYEDVGMRLKGNSSLMSLRGGRGGPGGFGGGQGAGFPGLSTPAPTVSGAIGPEPTASLPADVVLRGAPGGVGGPGGDASADEPEGLPWLVRLDRNVDGQSLEGGITDLVVRSNRSETSLNEAVALELLDAAGLASQHAAPTSFSVNGSDPTLRLIIENPDDTWQATRFEGDGALYKAESTGDWSYRGDDPDDYDEIFDQEAGKDVADLAPLLEFLRFINEADDATFASELPERFDIDAFATYLAMMDLVDNFDDIDGPGNNAYLHWDAATGVFTIVPWDMNLAFGGLGGGRMVGRGGDGDGGFRPPAGFDPTASFDPSRLPGGGQGRPGGFGGRGRSNPLVERFHDVPEFEAAYQAKVTELRTQLYESGLAQGILDRWTSVLAAEAGELVDAATIEQEAASIAEHVTGG